MNLLVCFSFPSSVSVECAVLLLHFPLVVLKYDCSAVSGATEVDKQRSCSIAVHCLSLLGLFCVCTRDFVLATYFDHLTTWEKEGR